MKISDLSNISHRNSGANDTDIARVSNMTGFSFPYEYITLLKEANGFMLKDGVVVYSLDDLIERNETFEVQKYAPGFFAIGDDSGGRSILLNIKTHELFLVDQGSMDIDDMDKISSSLSGWLQNGCRV